MCGGDIDRDAETMWTPAVCPSNETAIVGPLAWPQIRKEAVRQLVEFIRYLLQRLRRPVDPGELELGAVLARQPHDVDELGSETGRPAIAVHLLEQWHVSHPTRVEIDLRREALVANWIHHQEHIFDVRGIEHCVEGPGALAIVNAHARAVPPDKVVPVNSVEEIGICL